VPALRQRLQDMGLTPEICDALSMLGPTQKDLQLQLQIVKEAKLRFEKRSLEANPPGSIR